MAGDSGMEKSDERGVLSLFLFQYGASSLWTGVYPIHGVGNETAILRDIFLLLPTQLFR